MKASSCKQKCDEVLHRRPAALYVHVPFCRAKCRYCDFYSLPLDPAAANAYVDAVRRELAARGACLHLPLASVFVGGGTPSVLGENLLRELLADIRSLIDGMTEFSVEVNPGTVDEAVAAALVDCGTNRVNVGAQSFEAAELAVLGRIHTPGQTRAAVEVLRAAGIQNLGLDLIYGIPGQTPATWRSSLGQAMDLLPDHMSCYALSFEDDTPLKRDLVAGRVAEMEEPVQRDCYYVAVAAAVAGGLEHYEISNFARQGRRCRHNLTYWHNEAYLGVGPGATSYLDGWRTTTVSDLGAYTEELARGGPPASAGEHLTGRREMAETLMLGLRLTQGVDRAAFAGRFGLDPVVAFPRATARYAELGALLVEPSRIRISPDALFVADTVLADIVAEAGEFR